MNTRVRTPIEQQALDAEQSTHEPSVADTPRVAHIAEPPVANTPPRAEMKTANILPSILRAPEVKPPEQPTKTAEQVLVNARAELRESLAYLYDKQQDVRMLAHDAGLDVVHLTLDGNVANQWHEILQEAEKQMCVGVLINKAKERFGGNQSFKKAYNTYLSALASEISGVHSPDSSKGETAPTTITLTIEGDYDKYSEQDQQKLLTAINSLLSLQGDAVIIKKSRGSIKLSIQLPRNEVSNLYNLIQSGKLLEANISKTDLGKVNFRSLNLQGANLSRASLRKADFRGTDLRNANLEGAILDQAIYDKNTQWPKGFNPDERGALLFEYTYTDSVSERLIPLNKQKLEETKPMPMESPSSPSVILASSEEPNISAKVIAILKFIIGLIGVSVVTCIVVVVCLIATASIFDYLDIQFNLLWLTSGFTISITSILWLIRSTRRFSTTNIQLVYSITGVLVALAITVYVYILLNQ